MNTITVPPLLIPCCLLFGYIVGLGVARFTAGRQKRRAPGGERDFDRMPRSLIELRRYGVHGLRVEGTWDSPYGQPDRPVWSVEVMRPDRMKPGAVELGDWVRAGYRKGTIADAVEAIVDEFRAEAGKAYLANLEPSDRR